jgi:hypothetical protein
VSREAHARICKRLGVKFPGPTRRTETGRLLNEPHPAVPRLYHGARLRSEMLRMRASRYALSRLNFRQIVFCFGVD